VVEEALQLLHDALPAMIELRSDLSDDSASVLADPTQILQLLIHLGTNAAHSIGNKGGSSSASPLRP